MTSVLQPCSDSASPFFSLPPPFSLCLTEPFPRALAQTAKLLCMATVEQNEPSQEGGEENQCKESILKVVGLRDGQEKESEKVMEETSQERETDKEDFIKQCFYAGFNPKAFSFSACFRERHIHREKKQCVSSPTGDICCCVDVCSRSCERHRVC